MSLVFPRSGLSGTMLAHQPFMLTLERSEQDPLVQDNHEEIEEGHPTNDA